MARTLGSRDAGAQPGCPGCRMVRRDGDADAHDAAQPGC